MPVTADQGRMLTALAIACRPHGARRWDAAGVMAALKQVSSRSLPEVILATIRAAADRDVETPGVIPTAGSHWAEQLAPQPFTPTAAPPGTRCTICGRTEHGPTDHDFRRAQPKAAPDVIHGAIVALKAEVAATPPRPADDGLDALAARDPQLAARVEQVRALLPEPPMREETP